ncbi:MAG: ribonuclease Z [Paludibacter sp.]|nr:ribonuclease Z [Paludibacter sp.]MDD4198763.1 ribonuclease Z [Paludibacter sp.]MDD4426911.1 ribonuclease Z [Paludibacter sp.]
MSARLIILGAGSALPTRNNFPTSQILELREKQYMIDCGEGTQIRMRQMGLKINRLGHIFISHLHGDHCFGLIGLISSFGMLNRTADLYVHGPAGIATLFEPQLRFFCENLSFNVFFDEFHTNKHGLIYEDRSVEVFSIPLKHRVPCSGFLFREKIKECHIIREMIDYYQVPLSHINLIKKGADFITKEGETIPNQVLTTDPDKTLSYAYCSDTAYSEKIIPWIRGVDWLYHEATFSRTEAVRAKITMHSTAEQAASIALKAGAANLILGHFSARYSNQQMLLQEARTIFDNTVLAEDMKTFEL